MESRRAAAIALVVALAGCGGDDPPAAGPAPSTSAVADPALRDQLLAMLRADQGERNGTLTTSDDEGRARQLAAILDEHGWPGVDLVGKEAGTGAFDLLRRADRGLRRGGRG